MLPAVVLAARKDIDSTPDVGKCQGTADDEVVIADGHGLAESGAAAVSAEDNVILTPAAAVAHEDVDRAAVGDGETG